MTTTERKTPRPWSYGKKNPNLRYCPTCRRFVKQTEHEIMDDTPGFRMSWRGYECGHGHC